MTSGPWMAPFSGICNLCGFVAGAYFLTTCASKKDKSTSSINSKIPTTPQPVVPVVAPPKHENKTSSSDEKNSGGDGENEKDGKKTVDKDALKKSKKKIAARDSKESDEDGKNTGSKETDVKNKEKSKPLAKKQKEEKNRKSRKSKKVKEKMQEKKGSKSDSDEESIEKPPEPGSDPRRIWAFRTAKMKCQAICKLHQDKIKGYMPPNCTYTAYDANPDLNRYADVRCIEETRVVLKNGEHDYIHASWMRMPGKDQAVYITTQGPLQETLADFWQMVFQERISYVLMLCTLFEGGIEKCTLYYPEKLGEVVKFGRYEVTLTECKEEAVAGTTWNALTVVDTADSSSDPLYMNHVQVPWWPDQLAPEDPHPMIELYKWVKSVNPKGTPICVHCSAGVGRTATFVGIDYATLRIMENPSIEMVEIVREMRSMRFQAVQSHMQFLFLYVALLQYFIEEGVIQRTGRIEAFMEQYKKHARRKLAKRALQNQQAANDEKETEPS